MRRPKQRLGDDDAVAVERHGGAAVELIAEFKSLAHAPTEGIIIRPGEDSIERQALGRWGRHRGMISRAGTRTGGTAGRAFLDSHGLALRTDPRRERLRYEDGPADATDSGARRPIPAPKPSQSRKDERTLQVTRSHKYRVGAQACCSSQSAEIFGVERTAALGPGRCGREAKASRAVIGLGRGHGVGSSGHRQVGGSEAVSSRFGAASVRRMTSLTSIRMNSIPAPPARHSILVGRFRYVLRK